MGGPSRRSPGLLAAVGATAAAALLTSNLTSFVGGVLPAGAATRPQLRRGSLQGLAAYGGSAGDAKAVLMEILDDEAVQQEVLRPEGKPTRGRVDEAILALERTNPTLEPVYSELIDGTWKVKYSGSYAPGLLSSPTRELALFLYGGGFSLGNALSSFAEGFWGQSLGVKMGGKTVEIKGGRDVDAKAELEVGGQKQYLEYQAELMPLSAVRMSEEVISLVLPEPLGKRDVPLELRRSILVTYLDDEVMIVRDESGVPDVLVRQGGATAATGASAVDTSSISDGTTSYGAGEDVEGSDPLSSDAA
mmetsp:Transcript_24693/g.73448  ORF Transcript_24693/g.73448 Transcript_24693/m.73448 type:complete len:305 (+) Transcript_24693:91-1005(+)